MATIDLSLTNAKIYNVERFDIVKGEKFKVHLVDYTGEFKLKFDNDEVLAIKVIGVNAEVEALEVGTSEFEYREVNAERTLFKTLSIRVVEAIVPDAVSINGEFKQPEPK